MQTFDFCIRNDRTGKKRAERMTAFGSRDSQPERPTLGGSGLAVIGGERSDRFLDFTLGNPTSDALGKRIRFLHRQVCGFRRSLVDAQA